MDLLQSDLKKLYITGLDFYRTSYLREKDFFDSLEHQPPGLILLVGLQYDFPCD